MASDRTRLVATTLLFLGFCGIAIALWFFGLPWVGLLLPLSFAIAVYADRP